MEISNEVRHERERCVSICRRRAELWRNSSLSSSSAAYAREEARARANEAAYLADLLENETDLSDAVLDDDAGGTGPSRVF